MANTYNTGNPLPSSAPKDLYDNASNFDDAMNGPSPAWFDRFGVRRESWAGLSAMFKDAIANVGYVYTVPLEYAAGIVVSLPNHVFLKDGEYYKPVASLPLPYTTTGDWLTEAPNFVSVGDAVLRTDLASNDPGKGISLVEGGFRTVENLAALRALTAASGSSVFVTRHSAGRAGGGIYRQVPGDGSTADDDGYRITSGDGTRWAREIVGGILPEVYGAPRDGVSSDTAAIQKALDYGYTAGYPVLFASGVYVLAVNSTPGATFCLLNKGTSMIGVNAGTTLLVPHSSLSVDTDYFQIQPDSSVLDWMEIRNFMIYPGFSGTKRGKRSFLVNMDQTSNASSLRFDGVYCGPGNDISLLWLTDPVDNLQGGPANSVFTRSHFWEGVHLVNHGDSISFENCVFRSSVGSGRIGLRTQGINLGGGQPSQLNVRKCNFDCAGGAFVAESGLSGSFTMNNVELSHGTGSSSGAVVDLNGGAAYIAYMDVSDNNIGVFGAGVVGQLIRVANATGVKIRNNRLSSAGPSYAARAILITSGATDTELEGNEIGTNFVTTVDDSGVGTRGIPRSIAPINGFSNSPSGAAPFSVSKAPGDGALKFTLDLLCPAGGGSGSVFGVSPSGFRYGFPMMGSGVGTTAAGFFQPVKIYVQTNGNVSLESAEICTRIEANFSLPGLGFISGNL